MVQLGSDHGYCTLLDCRAQLYEGLSKDPLNIARSLHSKGFGSRLRDTEEKLLILPAKKCQKKGKMLYKAVIQSVEDDLTKYYIFISVLEQNKALHCDLLTVLWNTHFKLCTEAVKAKIWNFDKIIQTVISIAKKLEMSTYSQELERISLALQSHSIQIRLIGVPNAGKSTTANSFIGLRFITSSFRRQMVSSIRIIDDSYKNRELFSSRDSTFSLVYGVDSVRSCIDTKTLDSQCRTQFSHDDDRNNQYSELVLRTHVAQIEEKYEILDMHSTSEKIASHQTAAAANTALKSLTTAIVLVVSADDVFKGKLTDLVDNLKRIHPGLIERVIVLINKYDLCYKGNKPLWTADKLQEEMAECIGVPIEQTVCFSATYAQEAQEWMRNPSAITEDMYHKKYYDLRLTPEKDSIDSLKEHTNDNVMKLAKVLMRFSRFWEVEMKLLWTFYANGPEILLDSAADGCCGEISKMKKSIPHRIREIAVQGKENNIQQQQAHIKKVEQFFQSNTSFPEAILQSSEIQISAIVATLEKEIIMQASSRVAHLTKDYSVQESALQNLLMTRNNMLNIAEKEVHKACDWNNIGYTGIAQMKDILFTNLKRLLQELKQKVASEKINDLLNFNDVDPSELLETFSFLPVEQLDFAKCTAVSDDTIKLFILPNTMIKQKNLEKTTTVETKYNSLTTVYVEAVDDPITVFKIDTVSLNDAFHCFASFCSDQLHNSLQNNLRGVANKLSETLRCELQQVSKEPILTKNNELKRAEDDLKESKIKVAELENANKQLEKVEKMFCELPSLAGKKRGHDTIKNPAPGKEREWSKKVRRH